MWRTFNNVTWQPLLIGVALGLFFGALLVWIYYRQRIWVMQQRLWDYAERRTGLISAEDKRLMCPVCRSRSLHRSNKHSVGTFIGILFGRAPYRCARCFAVSMHRAPWLFKEGKRFDTYEGLAGERKQFATDLTRARKMKRLYPEMFEPRQTARKSEPPRNRPN